MKKYLFANASLVVEINKWAENKRAGDLEPSDFTISMNKGWVSGGGAKKKPKKMEKMEIGEKEDVF